jgi:hypothetical protein
LIGGKPEVIGEGQKARMTWSGRALQVDFAELAVSGLASMYPVSNIGAVLLRRRALELGLNCLQNRCACPNGDDFNFIGISRRYHGKGGETGNAKGAADIVYKFPQFC